MKNSYREEEKSLYRNTIRRIKIRINILLIFPSSSPKIIITEITVFKCGFKCHSMQLNE